jgi:hypothetical protein
LQSVSAELQAAILAQERAPVCRLLCDWDRNGYDAAGSIDDLTADVVSVDLTRELSTDLPPQTKLFAGAAAAQATITLAHRDSAGDPAKHGAYYYSPLNSASPLFSKKRKGAPARLELGFVGANGAEYVTVLEGSVRSLQVTSGGRVAVMRIADRSESMRRQVTVPLIVADGATETGTGIRVGLNTIFVADWIFRACGWYASPPPRANCLFSATMHGSAWPEIGQAQDIHGSNQSLPNFAPSPPATAAAKFVQALHLVGSSATTISYILDDSAGTTSTNNGDECLFEGWVKLQSTSVDQPLFIAFISGAAEPYVSLFWQQSTSRLVCTFSRAAADTDHTTGTSGPSVSPGTSAYHYYGVHVAWTSTGADVTFRYDGTSTGPVNVATSSFTGQAALNTIRIGHGKVSSFADGDLDALVEAVQFTREAAAGSWNNAFSPTADIHASAAIDSRIAATPHSIEEGWSLLQQVALAEFATTGYDEVGRPFYWPRDRWTTAPYTTSQRTLTPSTALKELESVEAIDQVRNHITAKADAPVVEVSSTVWKLGQRFKIDASGSRTIWASLPNPTANIDTSWTYGVTAGTGSRYAAGTNRDGTGNQVSNLTFVTTVLSPTSVKIVITNPNAFEIWLTVDGNLSVALQGQPYVWLDGQQVLFDQAGSGGALLIEAEDATSQADYGIQLLELPDSPWRQDEDQVTGIVADALLMLKQAGPILSDVPIVGDPRLQLGDRVTIVDNEGLAISGADFHLSKVDLTFDGEGLSGIVSLRSA